MYQLKSSIEILKELLFSICTTSCTACFSSFDCLQLFDSPTKEISSWFSLQVTLHLFSKYCFLSLKGGDVLERSSELIHSGDVIKTSNGSSQSCSMFLFDHQLVYCKKVTVSSEYWSGTLYQSFYNKSSSFWNPSTSANWPIPKVYNENFFCVKIFLSKVKVANNSLQFLTTWSRDHCCANHLTKGAVILDYLTLSVQYDKDCSFYPLTFRISWRRMVWRIKEESTWMTAPLCGWQMEKVL